MRAALCAGMLALLPALALAQQAPLANSPAPSASTERHEPGWFGGVGSWFERQTAAWQSAVQGMTAQMRNFGREAGIAAQTGADGAKQAADAVAKLPNARMATGHEKCAVASNGAPDCVTAAVALCKAKGFESGSSLDMTTAEDCPAKVYLSGRNSGPECTTFTFVSRALCR